MDDNATWHLISFLTGLSFYTSEKTLRAAFEGFGELVEGSFVLNLFVKTQCLKQINSSFGLLIFMVDSKSYYG